MSGVRVQEYRVQVQSQYILLISNHMIFLVQFRKFFQRPQIALALRASAILLVFEKFTRALSIPNCTRNHVITYTKLNAHSLALICAFLKGKISLLLLFSVCGSQVLVRNSFLFALKHFTNATNH